jgi:hypothetical protein
MLLTDLIDFSGWSKEQVIALAEAFYQALTTGQRQNVVLQTQPAPIPAADPIPYVPMITPIRPTSPFPFQNPTIICGGSTVRCTEDVQTLNP